ncbi:MAG TPA: hypothetical protein VF402_01610, partial [Asticcacaulis sp.]
NEQMLLSMAFGGGGMGMGQGLTGGMTGGLMGGLSGGMAPGDLLLSAQLMSAFGPARDDDDQDAGSAFSGLLG